MSSASGSRPSSGDEPDGRSRDGSRAADDGRARESRAADGDRAVDARRTAAGGRRVSDEGRAADKVLDEADATLLDVVDNLLSRGVMLRGEVILGLAGVDLVYLRLTLLLCAADKIIEDAG